MNRVSLHHLSRARDRDDVAHDIMTRYADVKRELEQLSALRENTEAVRRLRTTIERLSLVTILSRSERGS